MMTLKKYYLMVMVLTLFLVGCNTETVSDEDQVYKLKYSVIYNSSYLADTREGYNLEDEPKYIAIEKFAEEVKDKTNGRVDIEVHYSNQLVASDQLMEALSTGTVDLGAAAPYYYGDTLKTTNVFNLPYWSQGHDYTKDLFDETAFLDPYIEELDEYGVKHLFFYPAGDQGIMSKEPIRSIEDMQGKTFRIEGGLHSSWYEEMGTAPVNIAATEQYEGLQRGTVDGIPFAYYTLESYGLHEVVDYITVPGIFDPVVIGIYMSNDTWNELPEDLQEIIEEVSKEMEDEAFAASKVLAEEGRIIADEYGVEVIDLPAEELNKFIDSSKVLWDELEQGDEKVKEMISILNDYNQ